MIDRHQPLLTIVVCTYNAMKHLAGCIESIRQQKSEVVRLVMMDGGSTDGTLDEIQRHSDVVDHWLSRRDEGVYDGMNASLNMVTSDWVMFLGADDRLMPMALPRLLKAIEGVDSHNTVIYGDVYRPSKNVLYDGKFTKYKILRRNICQQSIVYPVGRLRVEGFEHRFKINADHILNIRLFFDNQVSMCYIPVCIAYFEDISEGLSRDRCDEEFIAYRRQVARESGGLLPFWFCCLIDGKEAARRSIQKILGRG